MVFVGWQAMCARAVEAHGERVRFITGGRVLAGPILAYLGLPFLAPEICTKVTIALQNWLLVCRGSLGLTKARRQGLQLPSDGGLAEPGDDRVQLCSPPRTDGAASG